MRVCTVLIAMAMLGGCSESKESTRKSPTAKPKSTAPPLLPADVVARLPVVAQSRAPVVERLRTAVTLSADGIYVKGKRVVAASNGVVDAADLAPNRPLNASLAKSLAQQRTKPDDDGVDFVVNADINYRLFTMAFVSASQKPAAYSKFGLLARDDKGRPVRLAFQVPKKTSAQAAAPGDPCSPARLRGPSASLSKAIDSVRSSEAKSKIAVKSPAGITRSPGVGDAEGLTPSIVMQTIRRRYVNGLRACHKRALTKNPKAGGKVRLRFTVVESGRVTKARAKGFDAEVEACITKRMTGWRFRPKPTEDGKPTTAQFTLSLQLRSADGPANKPTPEKVIGTAKTAITSAPRRCPPRLGLLVIVTKTQVLVASLSGLAGTFRKPGLSLEYKKSVGADQLATLTKHLADVKARNPAASDNRKVIIMADAKIPMQTVVSIMAAAAGPASGKALFTDVVFSAGIQ